MRDAGVPAGYRAPTHSLYDHPLVEEIYIENLVHPCDRDQHPTFHRQCTTREPCARSPRHKREMLSMTDAQHRLDLFR